MLALVNMPLLPVVVYFHVLQEHWPFALLTRHVITYPLLTAVPPAPLGDGNGRSYVANYARIAPTVQTNAAATNEAMTTNPNGQRSYIGRRRNRTSCAAIATANAPTNDKSCHPLKVIKIDSGMIFFPFAIFTPGHCEPV